MRALLLPGDGIGPVKCAAGMAVPVSGPLAPDRGAQPFQTALPRPHGQPAGPGRLLRAGVSRRTVAAALG
jgi:hypothetical protein